MSRQVKESKQSSAATADAAKGWASLTWDDVEHWAGSRSLSRGKAYQRQGAVQNLVLGADGRLLASVMGSRRYVTSAWLESGKRRKRTLASSCTCPVGASGCKHAVALVIAFLDLVADNKQVTAADPNDPRWKVLAGEIDESDHDDYESESEAWEDGIDEDDDVPERRPAKKQASGTKRQKVKQRTRAEWDEMIKADLGTKSREDLAEFVWSLVERFPELRQEFQERIELSQGDAGRLIAQVRRELREVTAEMGWRNEWTGEGHTPNYSRLKHRLERLVEQGYCDEVIGLGRDLIQRGIEQIEHSDDEGETGEELTECLEVVFDALKKSKLTPPDKIIYVIDASLADSYDILGESAYKILESKWSRADWSAVADRLAQRLADIRPTKSEDDFSRKYERDQFSSFLLDALKRAGRDDELLPIYEAEARTTGSYQRLVTYLVEQGAHEAAERWAREGIEKTLKTWPGIASGLAESLCEMARRSKKWDTVAAHVANKFFEHPSADGFKKLTEAADRAKCRQKVEVAALQFLETGIAPIQVPTSQKSQGKVVVDPEWPLPVPDYLLPWLQQDRTHPASRPHFDVLLDMAIVAKQPNDILRWYDKIVVDKKSPNLGRRQGSIGASEADRVAKAIATSHPERALDIWRRKLDANLLLTGSSAYELCAGCLRQMRTIYKALDQVDQWDELVADIRFKYRNRPLFIEALDRVQRKRIVESTKRTRR